MSVRWVSSSSWACLVLIAYALGQRISLYGVAGSIVSSNRVSGGTLQLAFNALVALTFEKSRRKRYDIRSDVSCADKKDALP